MTTYKIEFSPEDKAKYQVLQDEMDTLKKEMAQAMAREQDRELLNKILGPNWEIKAEFNRVAEREKNIIW